MKRMSLVIVLTTVVHPGLLQAAPTSYMGRLTWQGTGGGGSLSVNSVGPTAGWLSSTTSVSWIIDNTTTAGLWHYEYTITVPDSGHLSSDIQCVILETSPTFSWDNLIQGSVSSTPTDWLMTTEIGSFSHWENKNLPSDVYGIMFGTGAVDPTTLTISFDSDRAPVWGDIYARSFMASGQYNSLYNDGWEYFGDDDPIDPPSNGSILDHILVPDSVESPGGGLPIPAPGAVVLAALGASLAGWLRRKHCL